MYLNRLKKVITTALVVLLHVKNNKCGEGEVMDDELDQLVNVLIGANCRNDEDARIRGKCGWRQQFYVLENGLDSNGFCMGRKSSAN